MKIMLENLDKCLIFSNLELPHFRLQDMKIKPLPAQRDDFERPLRSDRFKQNFSIFLHRSHGTVSYHTKSLQLPSDGEVRTLVRTAIPYELQEEV